MNIMYYDAFAKQVCQSFAQSIGIVLTNENAVTLTNDESFYYQARGDAVLSGKAINLTLVHGAITLPFIAPKSHYFIFTPGTKPVVDVEPGTGIATLEFIPCKSEK